MDIASKSATNIEQYTVRGATTNFANITTSWNSE